MTEQTLKKQIAREYYNVLYGAKLNVASYDICEKLPTIISFISLSFGVLALGFEDINSKILGAILLLIGIVGITLKPRELIKDQYSKAGSELTVISKKLERLHADVSDEDYSKDDAKQKLDNLQAEHGKIELPSPILLSSWYAHYKVFSEHNNKWMCKELGLTWRDKIPLSLRLALLAILLLVIGMVLYQFSHCLTVTTGTARRASVVLAFR
jgi:hypothetical protein